MRHNDNMTVLVTGTRGIPDILGGIETHCEELLPRLADRGVRIAVANRKGYVPEAMTEWHGVKLVSLYSPRIRGLEAFIHTFMAIIYARCHKYKMVHIHAIGPALFVPLAKVLGMKVVFTHHGPDYDREKWGVYAKKILKLGEWCGVKWADEVIVISTVIKNMLESKYGRKDLHLIYNGAPHPETNNDEEYLKSLGLSHRKYVLGLWRFVPEKNIGHLIDAFEKSLCDENGVPINNIKLVLAGDADFEDDTYGKLKKDLSRAGIVMPGFVRGDKLRCLLSNARCFVLPSSHEGMSIALLEAMSYRLPVIVSDIDANKAMNLPDDCYFTLGNIDQLAEKLKTNADEEFYLRDYKMKDYDWDDIADKTIDVYEKCLKHHGFRER